MKVVPPRTEEELFARAERLAGRPLAWLAGELHATVPADLRHHKGWIGHTLEAALGATSAGLAQPDFPHLGVELKTLPVSPKGKPRESTFVCVAPLDGSIAARWEDAWVRRKLARVLWIPVVGAGDVPPGQRVLGAPLLWSPSAEEDGVLRADWEGLTALIAAGELWQLDGRRGKALQIRPKGASQELVWTVGDDGEWVRATPRGFYLRARFTAAILARHFALP